MEVELVEIFHTAEVLVSQDGYFPGTPSGPKPVILSTEAISLRLVVPRRKFGVQETVDGISFGS